MSNIRLGVDARPLSWAQNRGVQRVARNLLRQIGENYAGEIELFLYSNRPFLYIPPSSVTRTLFGTQLRYCLRDLPRAVRKDGCDVFLGTGPAVIVRSCPSIYIVYDGPLKDWLPQWVPAVSKLSLAYAGARLAAPVRSTVTPRWASALVFNSETSKRELFTALPSARCKPSVVAYWGVDPEQPRLSRETSRKYVASRLGVNTPFLLYVGAVSRPKNIEGLVSMYRHVRQLNSSVSLVVVGDKFWPGYDQDPLEGVEGVRWFRYLPDEALAALYGGCQALVTLSWYEGFGLPVVEAMYQGAPVVVSDRGALPEVVGEAGLVVDPSDPASAAQVVSELLADTGTLESQRKRSLVRSERFSWEVAAEKIVSLLRGFTGAGKTSGR